MAEKEERIVCRVIEKGYACDYCFSRPAHKYYQCSISNNDCTYDVCKECSLGMTRQEAIERISKALCRRDWQSGTCEDCIYEKDETTCSTCREVELYKDNAEAALNALLEENK